MTERLGNSRRGPGQPETGQPESGRAGRAALLLLVLALAPGCMMFRGSPEIRSLKTPPRPPAEAIPVHVDLQARVIEGGIHVDQDEYREQFFHILMLRQMLTAAGVMSEPVHRPKPGALLLRIQVEEVRTGPTALEVVSSATLRIIPSWTNINYRVRAHAVYRGHVLPPFEAEASGLLIQNLLLFPVMPFFAPPSARAKNRNEVVSALVRHVAAGLNAIQPPGKEVSP